MKSETRVRSYSRRDMIKLTGFAGAALAGGALIAGCSSSGGIEHLAGRFPGVISGGEAQRTALARALVLRPDILILDEPFSALDPTTKLQMYDMLHKVHGSFGCTIVFVTHDFNEADSSHAAYSLLDTQATRSTSST